MASVKHCFSLLNDPLTFSLISLLLMIERLFSSLDTLQFVSQANSFISLGIIISHYGSSSYDEPSMTVIRRKEEKASYTE